MSRTCNCFTPPNIGMGPCPLHGHQASPASGRSGAPGSWDRSCHWAFRLADPRRSRYGFTAAVPPYTAYGVAVTEGRISAPYGRSTHASAYLTHIPRGLLLAWRGGRFRVAQMTWRCGGRTTTFRLLEEPTSTVCPACTIERTPRQ